MRTYALISTLAVLLLTGCLDYNEYLVESDYSYHGKFKNYRTFNFVQQSLIDYDSSLRNEIVERAIATRMQQQGYRLSENKPNLLVSYKLFYEDFDFNGYNQPDIEMWADTGEEEGEEYDPITYNLREGTLLVLLFDRKRERSIWQGYASGVFGGTVQQEERTLRRAVRSIFDRYQFLAEGFTIEDDKSN
ncbi:DUF4136 domain-containing protein [Fulvivirgaceae bacterium BMA10]|uniref:DUF4136 domain-containing protein n=1 Tax=Splendidivirga corallicola TaxID=3051826 RepID=A0ABT8KMI0_9BACT|nr:DUF4136 domain-containing protein [Fulvivirgaceae bacterium BMA10]